MKMVAAAKLRRAQDRMQASRPYAVKMDEVITDLAGRVEEGTHPLLSRPEERERILVVVISSNRGLCGGFNSNLFRDIQGFVDERKIAGEEVEMAVVGTKARDFFNRRGYKVVAEHSEIIGDVTFKKAKRLAGTLMEGFVEKRYDAVYLCYNRFVSAIAVDRMISPLLPLTVEGEGEGEEIAPEAMGVDFIYEPNVDALLSRLLPGHIEIQVMQALFESEASEQAARMTAMDSATNNASDMIDSLTLQYNRARQAYITKEIVEIVSGAESLKG